MISNQKSLSSLLTQKSAVGGFLGGPVLFQRVLLDNNPRGNPRHSPQAILISDSHKEVLSQNLTRRSRARLEIIFEITSSWALPARYVF